MVAGAEGYLITVQELPAEVTVHIESALAQRLFGICHQMVLVLVNLGLRTARGGADPGAGSAAACRGDLFPRLHRAGPKPNTLPSTASCSSPALSVEC